MMLERRGADFVVGDAQESIGAQAGLRKPVEIEWPLYIPALGLDLHPRDQD